MKKIRIYFLTRQLREKVLLFAFVGIATAIWLSSLSKRAQARMSQVSMTSTDLAVHRTWLDQRVKVETAAKAAVEDMDPSRTFNGVRLFAEVTAIAGTSGITKNYTIDPVNPEKTEEFTVNTVTFRANQVGYDSVGKFYDELAKRAPYIGIERFLISATGPGGTNLSVNMEITSFEIAR